MRNIYKVRIEMLKGTKTEVVETSRIDQYVDALRQEIMNDPNWRDTYRMEVNRRGKIRPLITACPFLVKEG